MLNGFGLELQRLGPQADYAPCSLTCARAYCSRLARTHYENFSVATLLLPRRLTQHFHNVYAYCRWADDLGDETAGGAEALRLLAWWREELLRCYDGVPRHPVMVALQQTIRRFAIPPQPFLNLLLAFEQDQRVKRYDTYDQLLGYCVNSANPVGRLVLYLCGSHDETRGQLADLVCTGLQLANFWQDVARDFEIGRVYLPREDCERIGYSAADLEARRFTPAFVDLMRFQVNRARELLMGGLALPRLMARDVQLDIELFVRGGLAILRKIELVGYDVWKTRPALTKWEKLLLMGGAVSQRVWRTLR